MRRLITAVFLLQTLLFFPLFAQAKEYGNYDVKKVFNLSKSPSGQASVSFDLKYLDVIIRDLASHAENYPVNFDSEKDKQRATQDVQTLSGLFNILTENPSPSLDPEVLLRAGIVNSIGYNLDIPGSGEKVRTIFTTLLQKYPDHPTTNYLYGKFLSGAMHPDEAVPYLQKAVAGGKVEAEFTLGITYMILGDKDKALQSLESYSKKVPTDTEAPKIIAAIRSGNVEKKTSSSNEEKSKTSLNFDVGTYEMLNREGKPSGVLHRLSQQNGRWVHEGKQPGEDWQVVSCDNGCALIDISTAESASYFSAKIQDAYTVSCIKNKANALCKLSAKAQPKQIQYVLVALVTQEPILVSLQRIP